jgi:hypothetical protein
MEDAELWERFGEQGLSQREWNHVAHVRVAYLHLTRFEFDEAHLRLRAGIIRLNHRHGLEESMARGYFETLTRAWLHLVADARRRSGATHSGQLLERCPELLDRQLTYRYYSKELLASARARAVFIDPDLSPLPAL